MTIHSGHEVLRTLLPDDEHRRRFIANALRQDHWVPPLLIRAVHEYVNAQNDRRPINVTPAQARAVRDFIEAL